MNWSNLLVMNWFVRYMHRIVQLKETEEIKYASCSSFSHIHCTMHGSENVKTVCFLFDSLMYEMEAESGVRYYSALELFIVEQITNAKTFGSQTTHSPPHHRTHVCYSCSVLCCVFLHVRWSQYHVPGEYIKDELHSSKPFLYILSKYWVLRLTR